MWNVTSRGDKIKRPPQLQCGQVNWARVAFHLMENCIGVMGDFRAVGICAAGELEHVASASGCSLSTSAQDLGVAERCFGSRQEPSENQECSKKGW